MIKYRKLDIATWHRQDAYHFFKDYDDPFFSITAEVEVTHLVQTCKKERRSFFLNMLFHIHQVVNRIEAFRYRIVGEEVYIYEAVLAGSTVLKPNKAFCFAYFQNFETAAEFEKAGQEVIAKATSQETLTDRDEELYLIHYSSVPWISFKGIKHPRNFKTQDSIPKIIFGKYFEQNGKMMIPISVDVHHALMDGYDVGQFFNLLAESVH